MQCPHCHKVFSVDESDYDQIVRQVRDKEFQKELTRREQEMEAALQQERRVAQIEKEKAQSELEAKQEKTLAEKDLLIEQLRSQITGTEIAKKLAISEAVQAKEKELAEKATRIAELEGQIESKENESKYKEASLRKQFEEQIKSKDEQIQYYKDFKAKQSTKMIGESLEQHCLTLFNQIRTTAFPNAYFEKDNDARSGSKGDFIFRESSEDGTEFISIMFEMKNEADETATKHKNEDFFRELDKDRTEKGCEYAVLVSLLELDSELYNGITDVSYRYPKMYVVRPQYFIPIITLLRNAALNSLKYQKELQIVRNQQIDLVNFEDNLKEFKGAIELNYNRASAKFKAAIDDIDKTIKILEETKENLLASEKNLRILNQKTDDITIKKLTKDAPSVRAKLDAIRAEKGE